MVLTKLSWFSVSYIEEEYSSPDPDIVFGLKDPIQLNTWELPVGYKI